jgi:hypothetical protein
MNYHRTCFILMEVCLMVVDNMIKGSLSAVQASMCLELPLITWFMQYDLICFCFELTIVAIHSFSYLYCKMCNVIVFCLVQGTHLSFVC